MEERALEFVTYYEKQLEISQVSQQRLSELSGVSYASIRRFEKTGDISLASLVKLALALQLYDDLDNLFKIRKEYKSIEEVISERNS